MEYWHAALIVIVLYLVFKYSRGYFDRKPRDPPLENPSDASYRAPTVVEGMTSEPDGFASSDMYFQSAEEEMKTPSEYTESISHMALEDEVFADQDEYNKDDTNASLAPSRLTTTSHANDLNRWLVRRPDYHGITEPPGARTIHSEYASDMPEKTYYLL